MWASQKRALRNHLIRRDGLVCRICGEAINTPTEATIDHILPKSLGGKNKPGNLRLAHELCNVRRGNRTEIPVSIISDN